MEIVLGVDIGGTKTKVGLVDANGRCLEKTFFRTKEYPDLDDYLHQLHQTCDALLKQGGKDFKVLGCGIGAPNASSKNGTIENASNLLWKGTVPFLEKFKNQMDLPMRIMNDASAAALGEMLFGSAKNMTDFIALATIPAQNQFPK
ncbi:MAG: ROK family protein [Bacteroidota bacterium]